VLRSVCIIVVVVLVGVACTGSASTSDPTDVPEAAVPSRDTFVEGLDEAGWATYIDEVASWSVRYPPDWTVGEKTVPGSRLTLVTPSMESYLVIAFVGDALESDVSSRDYLERHVEAALKSGVFRPAGESLSLTHLDVDLDGRAEPQDIVAVELEFDRADEAADDVGVTSWFAYYDPAVRPGYAFAFETVGSDPEMTRHVEDIVFSFEPPGGYPGLRAANPVPPDPLLTLGAEVAVVETALGTMTWRSASSIPLGPLEHREMPSPGHQWPYEWKRRYENATEATGACFEIYEEAAGYLGIGPCPSYWQPDTLWGADSQYQASRRWSAFNPVWIWLDDVWYSADGGSWTRIPDAFPDPAAVVRAEPWAVAEHDGRWLVIGATGVGPDADVPWDQRSSDQRIGRGLLPPIGAEPAAWVNDDLTTGWKRVSADFAEPGTYTELTSVVAGDPGWFIFGIRSSQEEPFAAEWVAWTSSDGLAWDEMPMSEVYQAPCLSRGPRHCGHLKAHMVDDIVLVYAWSSDMGADVPTSGWRLLIGSVG
jgi:hypothetical protein